MTDIVGILNITPDSFSDGGQYDVPQAAYAQAELLIKQGAQVIDIGAESTRPDATPLDASSEWGRLQPCLQDIVSLAHNHNVLISIDTRHAATAHHALEAGVDWINDVSGGRSDAMLDVVAAASCRYVIMHSLSVPADKNITLPETCDVVDEVTRFFGRITQHLSAKGLSEDRIIYDVGLGFGKNAAQSLTLLWNAHNITKQGYRLLMGHSRKSCFALTGDNAKRDSLTLLASSYLMTHDIDYIRVHDVDSHVTLRDSMQVLPK